MNFDGQMIRNGMKVVATSEKCQSINITKWHRGMGIIKDRFAWHKSPMTLDDLRNLVHFYHMTEWNFDHFT